MIKMINKITGTEMYISSDRLDEYVAAGHKPMLLNPKEVHEQIKEAPAEKIIPVKRTRKKV